MKENAGIIPEGVWVLDQELSNKLEPASHTLWVLKDDGNELSWVSVETGPDNVNKVTSWTGQYGGEPSVVSGNGFIASVRALGPNEVEAFGEVPSMGAFSERSKIDPSGERMVAEGRVQTENGELTWREVFNLHSKSPHLPFSGNS